MKPQEATLEEIMQDMKKSVDEYIEYSKEFCKKIHQMCDTLEGRV